MTRTEFMDELRETLTGNMSESEIQSNLAYYNSYINEEMNKGKTEEEVLEELGSPFAIAKTLLRPYENEGKTYEDEVKSVTNNAKQEDSWKKILTIIIIIAIGLIVLSTLFGLLAFVIRYAVPISAIVLVVYFLKKK